MVGVIDSFSGEYRFLSNFWLAPVTYEGITYPSSEHAYQAAKSLNKDIREAFSEISSPSEIKRLGQTITIRPDWEDVKIKGDDPHYRVLAGWSGGYLNGDSWRMNSGIVSCQAFSDFADYFVFEGSSGSAYRCSKDTYGLRMNNAGVWAQLQEKYGDKVELMPEDTDWMSVGWIVEK